MDITAIDGMPAREAKLEEKPASAAKKIDALRVAGEDFEWYPTTPEIIEAMRKDLWAYLQTHENERSYNARREEELEIKTSRDEWDEKRQKYKEKRHLAIGSFLDIGAGDGRVLDAFDARKKYGIEIARAQADDLIGRGVFIMGRNYWDCSLSEQYFSLVFSNPPFSKFEAWVRKILYECNFCVLYLVMPVRWENKPLIAKELERYEATVVGEFDFSEASRKARGRVNLVRVNAPWVRVEGTTSKGQKYRYTTHQQTVEDAFERFVREHIADFEEKPQRDWEEEREQALALKETPIAHLLGCYEREKETLGKAFRAIGNLEPEIIKLMGQDKKSMLEIIRQAIGGLKSKYWRAAFDKLEPVQTRMTKKTRQRIFDNIREFRTMDFNTDNVYSIVIWIINNTNVGILDQIGDVLDKMTSKENIEGYKSNRHWTKGTWRNAGDSWKFRELPERWKLGLDYRIVVSGYAYSGGTVIKHTIVDDFIIICRNLGFPIADNCVPDYSIHSQEQKFWTEDGKLAFTMRYYTGNQNAHLKISKKLLMKFNVEVAKIRKWMSDPDDVAEEYDVPKDEAARLWGSDLVLLGAGDMQMIEFKEAG